MAGLLQRMCKSPQHDAWRVLARQVGGHFIAGGCGYATTVVARKGCWLVFLDTYDDGGENPTTWTRVRATYVSVGDFRFSLHRQGFLSAIGRWLGMQDIVIGHPPFDEHFVIKSNDEARVRALLDDTNLRRLVEAQPEVYWGARAGRRDGALAEMKFEVPRVLRDVDRLRGLFDLFDVALERLCVVGAALRRDPGVRVRPAGRRRRRTVAMGAARRRMRWAFLETCSGQAAMRYGRSWRGRSAASSRTAGSSGATAWSPAPASGS